MKVLAFAASLRKDSLNRKLVRIAVDALKTMPGLEIDHADYREFEMPIYDGDLEDSSGIPRGGLELIRRLRACDAVVISTPEYNGSIPGTLKNAVDWVSRDDDQPLEGKPVCLLAATPGGFAGVRGLWHTRQPFEVLGALVFPKMFGVPKADQAIGADGKFVDPKNDARLGETLRSYVGFATRLKKS